MTWGNIIRRLERMTEDAYVSAVFSDVIDDTLALLKERETLDTRESRIFQCAECGYGIDDIFINDEWKYQIQPIYCPNCGRIVKKS